MTCMRFESASAGCHCDNGHPMPLADLHHRPSSGMAAKPRGAHGALWFRALREAGLQNHAEVFARLVQLNQRRVVSGQGVA